MPVEQYPQSPVNQQEMGLDQPYLMPGYEMAANSPQVLPLDGSIAVMKKEQVAGYEYVQLAKIQMGESMPIAVWVSKDPITGLLHKDSMLVVTDNESSLASSIQERKVVQVLEGNEPTTFGRSQKGADKLSLDMSVSRTHLSMSLGEKGLTVTDLGSKYGTRLQAAKVENFELVSTIDRFESIHKDPAFTAIYNPGQALIKEVDTIFEQHMTGLMAQLEDARKSNNFKQEAAAETNITNLKRAYEKARTEAVEVLEISLKPYLAARLEQQRGDTRPGYDIPGQLAEKDGELVSVRGKRVGWKNGYGSVYGQSAIRYGQIELPIRFTSWAGSNGGKQNHQTGKTTTSTKHIVDLAAAMLSGNWKEEHEPINITPDPNAEYELPANLRGKIQLYKPLLGFHRIAADRLIEGLDGVVSANVI